MMENKENTEIFSFHDYIIILCTYSNISQLLFLFQENIWSQSHSYEFPQFAKLDVPAIFVSMIS